MIASLTITLDPHSVAQIDALADSMRQVRGRALPREAIATLLLGAALVEIDQHNQAEIVAGLIAMLPPGPEDDGLTVSEL